MSGGEGGIRTHGRMTPSLDFESSPFNRSGTSPGCRGPDLGDGHGNKEL